MEAVEELTTGQRISRTKGLPLLTYRENGFKNIRGYRLNDEEYGHVLQAKILTNVDIVFINSARRTMYLVRRIARPMPGWWWTGGNTGDINIPLPQAINTVLTREIGFAFSPHRFVFRFAGEYFCKDRNQEPRDMGCHMCALTFSVDITDDEIARVELDPKEYEKGVLREFTRDELVRENVFPVILDAYDLIFPPKELHHVVLIRFRENTPESTREEIYNRYQILADECGGINAGILSWSVKKNLDPRKNIHLVEVALFASDEAFKRFHSHPIHQAIAHDLSLCADWFVGDFVQ